MRRLAAVTLLALGLAATPALAHVEVLPHQAVLEQAQDFTLRVPTERPLPTTAVSVSFPPQVTVYAFAPPPPGWHMTIRERDGQNVGVRYFGSRIPVQQYLDFHFLGTPTKRAPPSGRRSRPTPTARSSRGRANPRPPAPSPPSPGRPRPVRRRPRPSRRPPSRPRRASRRRPPAAPRTPASGSASSPSRSRRRPPVGTGLLWGTRPMTLPTDEPGDDPADRRPRAPARPGAGGGGDRRGAGPDGCGSPSRPSSGARRRPLPRARARRADQLDAGAQRQAHDLPAPGRPALQRDGPAPEADRHERGRLHGPLRDGRARGPRPGQLAQPAGRPAGRGWPRGPTRSGT